MMTTVLYSKARNLFAAGWAILTLCLGLSQVSQAGEGPQHVDVALVLAIDASASVDAREMRLQISGTTNALLDDEVVEALLSGPTGASALAYVIWGDADLPRQVSDWHVITTKADVVDFSSTLSTNARRISGFTGIAAAIEETLLLLEALPVTSSRKVIDVSGDGRDTVLRGRRTGITLSAARGLVQQSGVTINGLAITQKERGLADWYRLNVASGPDHFVMEVDSFEHFAVAMRAKLLRELAPSQVAATDDSRSIDLSAALTSDKPPALLHHDDPTISTLN